MQKQHKAKVRKPDGKKFRKARPVARKESCIVRKAITKTINRKIETEMAARAVKFNETLEIVKVSARSVAEAGGKKPGKKRKN